MPVKNQSEFDSKKSGFSVLKTEKNTKKGKNVH